MKTSISGQEDAFTPCGRNRIFILLRMQGEVVPVPVQLYPHNQKAYTLAAAMLERSGKAAVVHPTGTGKSFIAFKLIEDHPTARFLWLSPSEYIFKTQCESVRREDPKFPLQNVRFATYMKLIRSTSEEIGTMQADYIILDEFHRCGAEHWSEGVDAVLAVNPNAKVLGMTATAIRYLDGQLDMSEVIFSGNIASEMTLGEAIVRGILPAPKYVTTVFKYQNQLSELQSRVEHVRGDGLKDANERYFEALRRALEQADGLDKVFARHMPDPAGKYIVFCSDYEHIQELRQYTKEWFGMVNTDIHSYLAYSADPSTSKEFASFKKDTSGALKLLYCINMLNEGVHVKGISGIILFRPTVSPIIYKQQIGRALTAGDSATPLIFDIVNNFEGLCSIDSIRREMQLAVQNFHNEGRDSEIVTERFEVIEQVENCRTLFEQLECSLSSNWEQYFQAASFYYAEYGDLQVPANWRTETGLHLGEWITTQRSIRAGKTPGRLSEAQISRLDSIGMVWENRLETAWLRAVAHCEEYAKEHGDLEVPVRYKSPDGYDLGKFINRMRNWYANGEKQAVLTPERIARLEALGMRWNMINLKWERNYLRAAEYYQQHGDLLVPISYVTQDGYKLGGWIRTLRKAYRAGDKNLTPERIKRLEAIGMFWGNRHAEQWEESYRAAQQYYREFGDLDIPSTYKTKDGLALGHWIVDTRMQRRKGAGSLTPERIARLDAIGMQWNEVSSWDYRYDLCRQYLEEHHCTRIPSDYKTADGIWLGVWLYRQRRAAEGYPSPMKQSAQQRNKILQLNIWGDGNAAAV